MDFFFLSVRNCALALEKSRSIFLRVAKIRQKDLTLYFSHMLLLSDFSRV